MKIFGYLCAGALIVLGLLFFISAYSTGLHWRWVPGAASAVSGLVLAGALAVTPSRGDSHRRSRGLRNPHAEEADLVCIRCGAALSALQCREYNGVMHVRCSECGSEFDLEEPPW